MENKTFYVKYLTNEPVGIETAYGRGPSGNLPLHTVAHLIAACATQPTRQLLGLPVDFGPLTIHLPDVGPKSLHQVSHDIEQNPLMPDVSLDDIQQGKTAKTALVIRSIGVGIRDFSSNKLPQGAF